MAQSVGQIYYEVDSNTRDLLEAERQVTRSTKKMEKGFDRTDKAVQRNNASLGQLKTLVGAVASTMAVQRVVQYADAWTNLQNQLRQVTDTQQELGRVTSRVLSIANETRTGLESTANLYARLSRASAELGLSEERRLGITRTINQAFAVSGATAQEAASAITQLSQGLASGTLRGEEFNAVAESAPLIMRAIAKELNMTLGQLREFAAEGGITADVVVRAMENMADAMDADFAKATKSFGQQMTIARNNMTAMVGDLDGLQGAMAGAGGAIVGVTEVLRNYSGEVDLVLGAMAGAVALYGSYRAALLLATAAQVAFNAAARANPYVAVATGLAAVVGALYSVRDVTLKVRDTTAEVKDFIVAAWELASEEIAEAWDRIAQPIADGIRWIATVFGSEAEEISDLFGDAMDSVMSHAKLAVNTVIGLFRGLAGAVEVVVQSIADNFKNLWTNVGDAAQSAMDLDFSAARSALERDLIDPLEAGAEMARRLKEELSTDHVGGFVDAMAKRARANTLPLQSLDDWFLKAPTQPGPGEKPSPGGGPSLTRTNRKERESTDRLAESYRRIRDEIRPLEASQREYMQSKLTLISYAVREEMGLFELGQLLNDLDKSYQNAGDAAEEYGFTGEAAVKKVDDAARDLGFTFSSAFEDAIVQGEDLRSVVQGLAQDLLRITTRKMVTEPLGNALTGAIGGMLGGGAGTYGGGTVGNLYGSSGGGWLSTIGSFFGGFFADGGYTGNGGKYEPAGIVHGGEFVVPKDVVDQPGMLPFLEQFSNTRGYLSGGYVGGASRSGSAVGSGGDTHITYAPSVTVQAQPGATQQDIGRQVKAYKQANKAQFAEFVREQQRPGGMLHKR